MLIIDNKNSFIGDIPRYQRSKLDSIFLVAVADHSVIDSEIEDKEQLTKQVGRIQEKVGRYEGRVKTCTQLLSRYLKSPHSKFSSVKNGDRTTPPPPRPAPSSMAL